MSAPDLPALPEPEFSRFVDIRKLDDKPLDLSATSGECAALASRFGLVAVKRLSARVTLRRDGPAIQASGRLRAAIVQSCAVSGEDLPVTIDEPVELRFVPGGTATTPSAEEEIELTATDCDEIAFAGDRFDLGEELAQSLALAIDPFAAGPEAEQVRAKLLGEEPEGPFAALAALRKPQS